MDIKFDTFARIKGEFEAEGLSRLEVAAEALFASRNGLDYLVKIGGAEAKSDIDYLADLGVASIVCPMIETPFAMKKYMDMLPHGAFHHIGVTIETVTAVGNIDAILDAGTALTDVTIGRTDLNASYAGAGVDTDETIAMVKTVARSAGLRGLPVTMGGSVSARTRALLEADAELNALIDFVETRKAVMPVQGFLSPGALLEALKLEEVLMRRRAAIADRTVKIASARLAALASRA
jgi:4-hydroxy-2-oxoheptanedioate aldolase